MLIRTDHKVFRSRATIPPENYRDRLLYRLQGWVEMDNGNERDQMIDEHPTFGLQTYTKRCVVDA